MVEQLKITRAKAREIIDCRGTPTVQVDMWVDGMLRGRADVPCGRSTGAYEAYELRDGDSRYNGLGVRKAVRNVNEIIAGEIVGIKVTEQRKIDELLISLDGTKQKTKLGANAILGVSLAAVKAASASLGIPIYQYINTNACILPVPMMNLINGGKLASNDLDFQEFIIMPVGAESFSQALQITVEINTIVGKLLLEKYGKMALNVGDEGGYVPPMTKIREPFEVLTQAVAEVGWEDKIVYALDVAATHLYDKKTGMYIIEGEQLTTDDMIGLYKDLMSTYSIASIEDPLQEDDFEGFARLTKELDIQIVGDDLFVTHTERLNKGIEMGAANALLWKYNQVGTFSEALDAAWLAFRSGYGVVVSERSGETEDSMIADCVVGLNAGQIKTGAPVRSERTSKYNQLLRIEDELGSSARYAGRKFRQPF
ncbi:MAG: phosphopyruvate hydratase [Dehalococcoidales bacterium]|nr:phosphopyruvate hydratase [Dehalococcoidales bacterium]